MSATTTTAPPRIATRPDGSAALVLTVLLGSSPRPGQSVADLVTGGRLALTLTAGPAPFAERVTVALRRGGPETAPLLTGAGIGERPTIALEGPLDAPDALDALDVLAGTNPRWLVETTVTRRTPAAPATVRITGNARDVHRALAELAPPAGAFHDAGLTAALGVLMAEGVVQCRPAAAAAQPEVVALLRSAIGHLGRRDDDGCWLLGPAPGGIGMPLDVTETVTVIGSVEVALAPVPLAELVAEALGDTPPDAHVRLTVAGPAGTDPAPHQVQVPPRTRAGAPARTRFVTRAGTTSLALRLCPSSAAPPSPAALLHSDAAIRVGPLLYAADDAVRVGRHRGLDLPSNLPVIDNPAAPFWFDGNDDAVRWYRPAFKVDPAAFRFLYRSQGTTVGVGGALGTGLMAVVRIPLERVLPAALDGVSFPAGTRLQPVAASSVSVALDVPFRVPDQPGIVRQRFPGTAVSEHGGSLVAEFSLLDNWVRLAYGSLSTPGFQLEPTQVVVSYSFRCYREVPRHTLQPTSPGGAGVDSGPFIGPPPYLVIDEWSFVIEDPPELYVVPQTWPKPEPDDPRLDAPLLVDRTPIEAALSGPTTIDEPVLDTAAFDAVFDTTAQFRARPRGAGTTWDEQTFVAESVTPVVVPCRDYLESYRVGTSSDSTAAGCQDALRLGETALGQFAEVTTLRTERMRVFRSLQQPDRVLVLPATYRIGRYGPAERPDQAYRPSSLIYATFGATPADHRYFITASLQPDLRVDELDGVREAMAAASPTGRLPVLELPTDPAVGATSSYRWAVPNAVAVPNVRQLWDTFQVSVSAALADAVTLTALIEHGGLDGDVTFALPDGTRLNSALVMDTRIVGPWQQGPVTCAFAAGRVTLVNHCERTVDVLALLTRTGTGAVRARTLIDRTIPPRSDVTVDWSGPTADPVPVAIEQDGPMTLQQIEVFVQDVQATIQFVNQLDLTGHGLRELAVEARLRGRDHVDTIPLTGRATETLTVTLPLTTYLAAQLLDLRLRLVRVDGSNATTVWRDWNLSVDGGVVGITATWLE